MIIDKIPLESFEYHASILLKRSKKEKIKKCSQKNIFTLR